MKKGNKGFINFYKSLKCNDFDWDNHIYYKEWLNVLNEMRIALKDK